MCGVAVIPARAQTAAGELTGVVTDQAGAAVSGATIAVIDTRTNLQRVVVSTGDGVYTVASLAPGEYRLEIELSGFKRVRREGVRLATGEKARIDFDLEVGGVQEQVTVVGDAPVVRAESASLGTVVEHEQVVQIQQQDPTIAQIALLTATFAQMVRQRTPSALQPWIETVRTSSLPDLQRFASGLQQDAAVCAALERSYRNGPTEGHVTRLKLLKRQMYGRAKLDLLRQRVLHAA